MPGPKPPRRINRQGGPSGLPVVSPAPPTPGQSPWCGVARGPDGLLPCVLDAGHDSMHMDYRGDSWGVFVRRGPCDCCGAAHEPSACALARRLAEMDAEVAALHGLLVEATAELLWLKQEFRDAMSVTERTIDGQLNQFIWSDLNAPSKEVFRDKARAALAGAEKEG